VEDKPREDLHSLNEEDTEDELFPIGSGVIDGVISTSKGDIKRELEAMVKQHQDDIEKERRQEEMASSQLIKQLQEAGEVSQPVNPSLIDADLEMAKKLSQQLEEDYKAKRLAEINASRKMFSMPTPPQPTNKSSSRIEGWINSSQAFMKPLSGNSNCLNNLQTPKKRASTSAISSGSEKKSRISKRFSYQVGTHRTRSTSKTSKDSINEQPNKQENTILTYLSPTSTLPDGLSPKLPSFKPGNGNTHSSEAINVAKSPDCCGSAFSPKSAHTMIPRQTIVYSSPFQYERLMNKTSVSIQLPVASEIDREISTPDSINVEVSTHFRPIKTAPKTPPKRLPDGSYMPDPPIVKSLPAKVTLPSDPSALYINLPTETQSNSPGKIYFEGKRNSDDSGRGSSSPEQNLNKDPTTPPFPQLVHYLSIPIKANPSIQAPVISPDGRQYTCKTSTLPRALTFECSPADSKARKSVIFKQEPADKVVTTTTSGSLNTIHIKQEQESSDYTDDIVGNGEENIPFNRIKTEKENEKDHLHLEPHKAIKQEAISHIEEDDLDATSLSLILEESAVGDVKVGTPVRKILESEQEKEFRRIQERAKQMEADMKFAEKLQKMFNQGKNVAPPKSYSLRSWMTPKSN